MFLESNDLFFALLAAAGVYFLSQDNIFEEGVDEPYTKRIVIVHSETCGHCVDMLANVINDENMKDMGFDKKMDDGSLKVYYNGNTRIELVNASKPIGQQYMDRYKLDGVPSFIIFDNSGNSEVLLKKQSGALNLQEFESLLVQ